MAELVTWAAGEPPRAPAARLKLVDRLIALRARIAELDAIGDALRGPLGPLWAGRRTDIAGLAAAAAWLDEAGRTTLGASLRQDWDRLRPFAGSQAAADAGRALGETVKGVAEEARALFDRLALDVARAFGVPDLGAIPLEALARRLEDWSREGGRFPGVGRPRRRRGDARRPRGRGSRAASGVRPPRARGGRGGAAPCPAPEAVWRVALERHPRLSRLDGDARSALVAEFKRLEHARRAGVAALIRARHAAAMPRGAMGEMGVVRGEAAKRRGHMAIRKLMTRAGPSVRRIKPIFLMSPISVAQYLPPGRLSFDLVVIDEGEPDSARRTRSACWRAPRASSSSATPKQLPPHELLRPVLMADAGDAPDDEADDPDTGEVAPLAGAARATELESILHALRGPRPAPRPAALALPLPPPLAHRRLQTRSSTTAGC